MKLGWHGARASGAPEEVLICESRADTSLTSSAVSPATKKQTGEFQRTSESSSVNPGLRVIARTNAVHTLLKSGRRAASAVTSDGVGRDSAVAGCGRATQRSKHRSAPGRAVQSQRRHSHQ